MNLLACMLMLYGANAYHDTFNRGCAAFSTRDYAAAIQAFEQIVAEDVADPAVFYNLGNAYYRSGRLGPAIANYERALHLDPGFENARENLAKAVRETKHRLARPGMPPDWKSSLFFWHYDTGRYTSYRLAMLFWWAFWIAAALRFWRPVRYLRRTAAILGVLSLIFGVSAWHKAHPVATAVAVGDRVAAHYGTDDSETVRFELAEGDRVAVDRQTNGWMRVTTANGDRGWVHAGNLILVGPPYMRPPEPVPSPPGGVVKP